MPSVLLSIIVTTIFFSMRRVRGFVVTWLLANFARAGSKRMLRSVTSTIAVGRMESFGVVGLSIR